MKISTLYRESVVDESTINEEKRTVDIVFSTEMAVERHFGMEILDHSPSSVDLGRLEQRGAVLVGHNPDDHVGVVDKVSIDPDKIGRATVRFGRSKRAKEVFNDIVDGIRGAVSVGYRIHEMRKEKAGKEGLDQYRATKWQPLELSFVSIPADPNCQVGRSYTDENDIIITNIKETIMSEENKVPAIDLAAERATAQKDERTRGSQIAELGEKFEAAGLARDFINSGKSVDSFRVALLDKQSDQVIVSKPATEIGLTEKEVRGYSIMNAIRAAASGDWSKAEFERECSLDIAEKLDREAKGFFVPFDVQRSTDFTRVTPPMNTTDTSNLVATEHMAGSFIDQLRNNSVVLRAGGRVMAGLVGNVDIPKQTAGSTFTWLAEDADAVDSDVTIGQVTMTPRTIGGAVPITRRLLKQGTPDAEALVRSDLIAGAALAIDLGAISGSGAAGQPTGILNATGINTSTILVNNAPTFAELVAFETAVLTDNALMGALQYVSTPAMQGYLKTSLLDSGSGRFLMEGGQVNGYNMDISNQMALDSILFGNFNDVIIGMWGVLDLSVDIATKAASGGIVLRAFQDVDVAVRHAESFCKGV